MAHTCCVQRTIARLVVPAVVCVVGAALPASSAAQSPSWTAPHRLSASRYAEPTIATNAAGASIAVWQQPRANTPGQVALVATRDANTSWSASRRLTIDGRASQAIFAGIGGRGRAVMVWAAQPLTGGPTHVLWSQRRPHASWTRPLRVPGRSVIPDSFSLSSAGWGVIAYTIHGVGYVRVLTPRGRWRGEQRVTPLVPRLHHDAVSTHTNLHAVISSTGAVTATWVTITVDTRSRTAGNFQRGGLTSTGARLAPTTLATDLSAYGSAPHLEASATGNSVAIDWDDASNHETVTIRLAGGSWRRYVAPIDNGLSGSADSAVQVSLSDHRAALWWQSWTDAVATLYEARYDGSAWSPPSAIAHYDNNGPISLAEYGAVSDRLEVLGWTQLRVMAPAGPTDSTVRTTHRGASQDLTLGPAAVVAAVTAGGDHAAVVWSGKGGLFVQTRET